MNYETLDACVRKLRTEMIDFTSELVGIASENPPGAAYPECVRAIASRSAGAGHALRDREIPTTQGSSRHIRGRRRR